jgi:hypothetical protein
MLSQQKQDELTQVYFGSSQLKVRSSNDFKRNERKKTADDKKRLDSITAQFLEQGEKTTPVL